MNPASSIASTDTSAALIASATSRLQLAAADNPRSGQPGERIGKDIESMFASMLIKTMRESFTEDGLFPGDKSDALGSLFDQYMGEQIASGGGLGLAQSLRNSNRVAAEAYRMGSRNV